MFRLMFALLAYVWTLAFAGDDSDDAKDDEGGKSDSEPPKEELKHSDKTVNKLKGEARKEGRTSGEKSVLEALGFDSVDDAKQRISTFRQWEEDEKTELDKAADCIDRTEARAKKAEQKAEELETMLKARDRRDAILSALSEANYTGKTGHAVGAIDASFSDKVKEDDGAFDAAEAVKALKEDEFPGFAPDLNPPPDSQRTRNRPTSGDDGKSRARRMQDRHNERMKTRRGY